MLIKYFNDIKTSQHLPSNLYVYSSAPHLYEATAEIKVSNFVVVHELELFVRYLNEGISKVSFVKLRRFYKLPFMRVCMIIC